MNSYNAVTSTLPAAQLNIITCRTEDFCLVTSAVILTQIQIQACDQGSGSCCIASFARDVRCKLQKRFAIYHWKFCITIAKAACFAFVRCTASHRLMQIAFVFSNVMSSYTVRILPVHALCKLPGSQQYRQLGVCISVEAAVLLLGLQIIKSNPASCVGQGSQHDHPCSFCPCRASSKTMMIKGAELCVICPAGIHVSCAFTLLLAGC